MSVTVPSEKHLQHTFSSAEMGAIAHLYRGEVYRSTIWRTRLDNTTNWSIVTMGIALSKADSAWPRFDLARERISVTLS